MIYKVCRDEKTVKVTEDLTEAIEFIASKKVGNHTICYYLDDEIGTIATNDVNGFKFCNVILKTENQDRDERALSLIRK